MEIKLRPVGLDESLNIIDSDLASALNAKTKQRKDEYIHHARGVVKAFYRLIRVVEEPEDNSEDLT